MPEAPRYTIVIPAYNEEGRIAPTLESATAYYRALGEPFELLVVDDGSRDGTSRVVQGLEERLPELRLIRLAANHGKGYAVRAGMLNGRGELRLFADADGATPWPEFERLRAAIAGGADVAIGSRALHADGTRVRRRWYRHLMGRAFHALVRLLTVDGIADTQCGFKLFRAPVAEELFSRMRMNGFSFDVEVLLMARRQGRAVAEVPVNWEHQPGSRVNLVRDSLRMARDLLEIRAREARGGYDAPHVGEASHRLAPE